MTARKPKPKTKYDPIFPVKRCPKCGVVYEENNLSVNKYRTEWPRKSYLQPVTCRDCRKIKKETNNV